MITRNQEAATRRQGMRLSEEILMGRADLLAQGDRDLVEAVFVRGHPTGSLARMMGTSPRRVRDRARSLVVRLNSSEFLDAARALPYLSAQDAELAKLWFCQKLTQRGICTKIGATCHTVRRRLEHVRAQITTIHRMNRSRGFVGQAG